MRGISILLTALLSASGASAENWTRVTTEEVFRATVVGKELCDGGISCITVLANGRQVHEFRRTFPDMIWEWNGAFYCRSLPGTQVRHACSIIEVSGNKVRITTERGQGQRKVYTW